MEVALELIVIASGFGLFGVVAIFITLNTLRARRGQRIPERRHADVLVPALGLVFGVSMTAAALASDAGTTRWLQLAVGISVTAAWAIMIAAKGLLVRT